MGVGLLRSYARYGPVPLPPVCGRGVGVFLLGTGDWDCWEGCLGWLRGTGPALAGMVREVRAFALTRDGDRVAAILCSLRPSPAAAGVWSGFPLGMENGDCSAIWACPALEICHPNQAKPGLLERDYVTQTVEGDPEELKATQADAQWQQEFPEQVSVQEPDRGSLSLRIHG